VYISCSGEFTVQTHNIINSFIVYEELMMFFRVKGHKNETKIIDIFFVFDMQGNKEVQARIRQRRDIPTIAEDR